MIKNEGKTFTKIVLNIPLKLCFFYMNKSAVGLLRNGENDFSSILIDNKNKKYYNVYNGKMKDKDLKIRRF